jgi:hypothetical protein
MQMYILGVTEQGEIPSLHNPHAVRPPSQEHSTVTHYPAPTSQPDSRGMHERKSESHLDGREDASSRSRTDSVGIHDRTLGSYARDPEDTAQEAHSRPQTDSEVGHERVSESHTSRTNTDAPARQQSGSIGVQPSQSGGKYGGADLPEGVSVYEDLTQYLLSKLMIPSDKVFGPSDISAIYLSLARMRQTLPADVHKKMMTICTSKGWSYDARDASSMLWAFSVLEMEGACVCVCIYIYIYIYIYVYIY